VNKYFGLVIIFFVLFLMIAFALKERSEEFAIYESNQRLNHILTNHQALHLYVENIQKSVIYQLKSQKKLYEDFFDPKVLSFTYIARNIHTIENEILKENNESLKYYKLASINPRNERNRANEFEKTLIEKFNSKQLKEDHKEIIEENGAKYLLFIKPVTANQPSCMKCHGDPKDAPKELLLQYGDKNGFYEKLNFIRAIMSIKIPLQKELDAAKRYYYIVLVIVFLALFLIYLIIYVLMRKIDKKNEKLEKLANIDQLTGCYNRRSFHKDLVQSIQMCENGTLSRLCLATFDIDHFKSFNDRYGHPQGDRILEDIAALVQSRQSMRERLYRVGGEEFMIVYPNATLQEALFACEQIRQSLKKYQIHGENITLSFGVCRYNPKDDYGLLYKKVDDALYLAKERGRDRIEQCNA